MKSEFSSNPVLIRGRRPGLGFFSGDQTLPSGVRLFRTHETASSERARKRSCWRAASDDRPPARPRRRIASSFKVARVDMIHRTSLLGPRSPFFTALSMRTFASATHEPSQSRPPTSRTIHHDCARRLHVYLPSPFFGN